MKNVCLRTTFDLRLNKKTNKKIFGANLKLLGKIFVSSSKKCQSCIFNIWEMYDKHFFSKNENLGFLSPDCFIWIKQPQKLVHTFWTIFRNCMKIVWQAFFHTLDLWNCMISIFGVWRSTQVTAVFQQTVIPWSRNYIRTSLNTSELRNNCITTAAIYCYVALQYYFSAG